ncbi:UNVERIFIED_CONTAM: hypothetical protein FKN15_003948 [Acipenser sinensis]
MIKCLSKELQAKLRSGIAIFSLTQCVEELLLNSIDAAATCVAVRVDVEACKIQVLDSGFGMDREDMESVGNRYFTSKCSTVEDLENLRFYGFRGEAIASIANVANLVEISSRTSRSAQTFGKVFKDGKPLDVYEAETTRPSSGTTVVICNLFYNLPVRRKSMNSILECERIRQRIEAISLMHPSVSFTLKNDSTGSMVVQLSKSKSSYYRFTQIYGLGKSQKLREISYSYKQFEMSGYISREGHYNSSMQFLYVNSRLVLKTRLHKLINILLKKVSVVCKQKDSQKIVTTPASPSRHRASSELQGVYVINIKCHYSEYDVCIEPAKTLIEFRDWDGVLVCVEEGVKKFLTRENLVAEISNDDIQEFIEEGNLTMQATSANSNACEENDIVGSCKSACENIIEPYDIKTLRSKTVQRPLVFASNVSGSNGNENVASSNDLKEKIPLLRDRTNSRSAVADDNSSSASNVQSLEKETNKNQPAKASEISGLCVTSDVKNNCFEECNSVTKLKTILCMESSEDTLKQFESQDSKLMDNNKETEKNIDLDPALHVEGSTACTQSEVIHAEGSTACTQSEVIHVEGSTACTQSEVIHVEGSTACTQSEVIHVEGSTACTQSEVIHVEGSTACTQSEVIHVEGSTACTQSEVIHVEGSTACTQSEVIHVEGSTACTQSEVIHVEGSTACTQSEVIHVEGSTACTQSEVIHVEGSTACTQSEVIHVEGSTACTQSEVIHVEGSTACTQSEVIHVEGSTACTQSEVIHVEGSTACTQSEVIHVEGSTACTQSEVIHVEGSTACTQSEVIHVEGSTACTQSEVIHAEGSTACTQSEVIQLEKHNPASQTDKAINTESVRPKLGTTGFIHHVIPIRNENENKNHEELVRFCHRGPVSAQDIFKEKQHKLEQNTFLLKQQCCTLTMQHVKQSSSEDWRTLFSSRGDTFSNCVDRNKQSDESNRKITLSNILKTVEDFKGSMDTMVGLSTGSQTKRSKLSLPVRIGSLDRFRRMYGKMCPYAVQYSCQDSNNNLSTAAASNPAEAKRDASTSNEEDSCSRSNNSSKNWERNDYTKEENAITLSDYTQIKKASLNTSKPHGSLATKLSKLKGYQKNDTKVQPVGDISVSGAQKDSGDLLLMHSNNSNAETSSQMPPNKKTQVTNKCLKGCESGENNIEQAVDFEGNQKEGTVISATYLHPDTGYKGCALIAPGQSDGAAQCHYCNDDKEISSKAILGSPNKVNECSDLATCKARFEDASKKKEIPSTTQSSSDWVEHFDVSVGRMAYINTVTGLSKYVAPPEEETQAICTTDITTMAVNVVSEKGFEYRCYPFQIEAIIPFLPRPRVERASSGQESRDDSEAAESVRTLFSEWENPVFVRHPEVALDVSSGQAESLAVKIHNILYPYRFTKEMINSMEVVQQVDNKFIACLINTRSQEDTDKEGNLLVLVDQHAAHERVRLEKLVTDSYEPHSEASGPKRLCSSTVCPPLEIDVTEEELRLLRSCQTFLKELALEMTFAEREDSKILVGKVPVCFIEREANELRRGRQTVTKAIVEEYLREQIELIQSTGRVRGTLPLTVLKVLASQACHGAIKFNDSLSMEECCRLIESLSVCQLPFQCAHGRPSMLPLVDLDHLEMEKQDPPKPNLMKLRKLHRAWELYGKQ